MTPTLDAVLLADALDAWESDPNAYSGTISEAFEALCPIEAQVLFQLAQGVWYDDADVPAVARLIELGLVRRTASLTPVGRRLLNATGKRPNRARLDRRGDPVETRSPSHATRSGRAR
jgi:hypothetical protein